MTYSNHVPPESLKSLSNVIHTPYWLDDPLRPAPEPALTKETSTDLLIIGAGYSGLWTALLAREANPDRDIIILEAGDVATIGDWSSRRTSFDPHQPPEKSAASSLSERRPWFPLHWSSLTP